MKSEIIISVVLCMAFQLSSQQALTGDTQSSFRVVGQLCSLPEKRIEAIAHDFFCCYDQVPKEHFAACQMEIFGCIWDNLSCIQQNCPRFMKVYQSYVTCIQGRFQSAGLSLAQLMDAGTKINVCQGRVAGL